MAGTIDGHLIGVQRSGLALLALVLCADAATAETALQPHRAVYDLTLERTDAAASLASASGRLVFDLSGSPCEGYVVNLRFVTSITDGEGSTQVTDVRSSTFETLSPATFTFNNRTLVDDALQMEVKGIAEARDSGLAVEIETPKETEITLDQRAIFPSAHTHVLLEAAQNGERVREAMVYDGGENADMVYDTTAVIGEGKTGLPNAGENEREALAAIEGAEEMTAWRFILSFFAANGEPGERMPDQELTFTMLQNGVSYDATFDYGAFALGARLAELEVGTAPDC